MITHKQAAEAARRYLADLYSDAQEIRLEEVEPTADQFHITLSYWQPSAVLSSLRRVYKVFEVDKTSGEVLSMRISPAQNV